MSLGTLSPELLSCVLANIESKHTLYNLAQCSRQLYFGATPHLYRRIVVCAGLGNDDGKLRDLALTLIRRQDLARLVRHFTFRQTREYEVSGPGPEQDVPVESVEIEGLQDYTTAVNASSLSTEEHSDWLRSLSHKYNYHVSTLALILPLLLRVEKLDLGLQTEFGPSHVEWMIGRASRRDRPFDVQPPFTALTELALSHQISHVQSPVFLASLLKLPAIEVISGGFGNYSNWGLEESNLTEIENFSSPLSSLDLTGHELSIEDLGHILRAPRALKTFSYTYFSPFEIDFREIRHALGPQQKCLESLSLDLDFHFASHLHGNNEFLKPMTSFLSFNSLKIFRIAAPFLKAIDEERDSLVNLFPASLETLHLTGIDARSESVLRAVEDLLGRKSPERTPSLTRVILESHLGVTNAAGNVGQMVAMGRLGGGAVAHEVTIDASRLRMRSIIDI
ncbi:hypothetical protein MMC07_008898 [Pseudocyphellaria aurata]|nr:hypothetical protein [Pseudocyphellaria aurata]